MRQQEAQSQILAGIKRQQEEEEARRKMEALYINQYLPPETYYDQFGDNDFFN